MVTLSDNFTRLLHLLTFVQEVYNTGDMVNSKFAFYKKTQVTLKSMLKAMFPTNGKFSLPQNKIYIVLSVEVLDEYKHPDLIAISGRTLELDFFYPQLNLAIELQVKPNPLQL
jgi:hypothetical protein